MASRQAKEGRIALICPYLEFDLSIVADVIARFGPDVKSAAGSVDLSAMAVLKQCKQPERVGVFGFDSLIFTQLVGIGELTAIAVRDTVQP